MLNGRLRAATLLDRLLEAETPDVPGIVAQLTPYRRWVDPLLLEALNSDKFAADSKKQLHIRLALLPLDADQGPVLQDRLLAAGEPEIQTICQMLVQHGHEFTPQLWAPMVAPANLENATSENAISENAISENAISENTVSENDKDNRARQQARIAATLLSLGADEPVWPRLADGQDPRLRTWLIHQLKSAGVEPRVLADRLQLMPKPSIMRALILSLGAYSRNDLPADSQSAVMRQLESLFRDHPDPGVHSSVEWLLRRWEETDLITRLQHQLQSNATESNRRWYINGQNQTFAVVTGPVEFQMGSPSTEVSRREHEALHRRRISRSFAIGTTEVTIPQFNNSPLPNPSESSHNRPHLKFDNPSRRSAEARGGYQYPVNSLSQTEAMMYCNWLSEAEGIPSSEWCYSVTQQDHGPRILPVPGFLSKTGYRLPTEAEWEYSCRAGAITSRHFGHAVELLTEYGWYHDNSLNYLGPIGMLEPNDLGLFDIYGSVSEWCQDAYGPYPTSDGVVEDDVRAAVTDQEFVVRGGSFTSDSSALRSAQRVRIVNQRLTIVGFRVARTLPKDHALR